MSLAVQSGSFPRPFVGIHGEDTDMPETGDERVRFQTMRRAVSMDESVCRYLDYQRSILEDNHPTQAHVKVAINEHTRRETHSFEVHENKGKAVETKDTSPENDESEMAFATVSHEATSTSSSSEQGTKGEEYTEQQACETPEHTDQVNSSEQSEKSSGDASRFFNPFPHYRSSTRRREHRPKAGKKNQKKVQGKNKKWKRVSVDSCGFDLSLLPWVSPSSEVTEEMDHALDVFMKSCENKKEDTKEQCSKESKVICPKKTVDFELHEQPLILDLEWKLNTVQLELVETFAGTTTANEKRLRRKKKWRVQKAHKQVKSKHCQQINNAPHGINLVIHFRLAKLMPMVIDPDNRYMVKIRMMKVYNKTLSASKGTKNPLAATPIRSSRSPRHPAKAAVPSYALSATNADFDLEADLVNILLSVQNRDLTPEDYDLLLRLDERVQAKSVDAAVVDGLRTDSYALKDVTEHCAICMDEYEHGDLTKYLPCGHYFHGACVDQWLKGSTACPLDGLEIAGS